MPSLSGLLARTTTFLRDIAGPAPQLPPPPGAFERGINFGGGPVTVQGERWEGHETALRTGGLSVPGAHVAHSRLVPTPHAERGMRQMLNTGIFRTTTLDITLLLDDGAYALVLWIMENHQSHWHRQTLRIQGELREEGVGDLERGAWGRYGPYPVTVNSGMLSLALDTGRPDVDAHAMGLSLYRVAPGAAAA